MSDNLTSGLHWRTRLIASAPDVPGDFRSLAPAVHRGSTVTFSRLSEAVDDWRQADRYTYGLYGTPGEAFDEIGDSVSHILVDYHGEATSDKQVMARHLDGRVTAVLGTHTHVPTADASVLPGGTAFQCDVGMCGPYDSIIGRDIQRVMQTTRTFEPVHFYVATRDVRLCGAIVESNPDGRAQSIERFELKIDD